MFASVDLSVPLGRGLVVPADAVLDSGARQLVFVSKGDGYFEPRSVVVGHRVEGRVEITQRPERRRPGRRGRGLLHRLGKPAPRGRTGIRRRRDLAIRDSGPD